MHKYINTKKNLKPHRKYNQNLVRNNRKYAASRKCGGRSLKTDQGAKLTKLKLGVDRGGGVEYGNK